MRMADDFLLVSARHDAADRVARTCMHELPKHNVHVSTDKMCCNVRLPSLMGTEQPSVGSRGPSCGPEDGASRSNQGVNCAGNWNEHEGASDGVDCDGGKGTRGLKIRSKVPWCGLLLNTKDLSIEVRALTCCW